MIKYLAYLLMASISVGCATKIVIDEVDYSELNKRMIEFPENRLCSWSYDYYSTIKSSKYYYFIYYCMPDVRPGGSTLYPITSVKVNKSLIGINEEKAHGNTPITVSDVYKK